MIAARRDSSQSEESERRTLKTLLIFVLFLIPWHYMTYEMNIFFELADNGLLNCTTVVAMNSRKWGHFGGGSCATRCTSGSHRLVGMVREIMASER